MSKAASTASLLAANAWRGAAAGLVGGVGFGIVMALAGILPMVAMLVGSENPVVGALVHMVIAALIGLGFGVIVGTIADHLWMVLTAGAIYGAVWWVLGALVTMPAWLGMPLFNINQVAVISLLGHLVYGLAAAAMLYELSRRTSRRAAHRRRPPARGAAREQGGESFNAFRRASR